MPAGRHRAPRTRPNNIRKAATRAAAVTAAGCGIVTLTPSSVSAAPVPTVLSTPAAWTAALTSATPAAPSTSSTGASYVVQPGDWLSTIAPQVGEDWPTLYTDNRSVVGDDPNLIVPGQVLALGRSAAPAPTPPRSVDPPAAPAAAGRHAAAVTGADIVADARAYLGVPYVWGGSTPAGFDCSGLVQYVLAGLDIQVPRVAADQATVGTPVNSLDEAQPGDLLFFDSPIGHVGIYVGNGQMLDAPDVGQTVKIESVWATPTAIRRVV